MKGFFTVVAVALLLSLSGCAPLETIATHHFASGYYNLKPAGAEPSKVYADVNGDSLAVYPLKPGSKEPDIESAKVAEISKIDPGSYLYKSSFRKASIDADLSTVITKLRPASSGVPIQLNSTINAIFYLGARRDFYIIRTSRSVLNNSSSFIRQLGYDAGFFAGMGITPVNPTVTNDRTLLEYDGVVFQKGIAAFVTIDNLSIGVALGFDNLLGGDSDIWIYNNKPWVGIVLGIANF